ncbi:hypothetical protein BC835DRAFT_445072 [Cytidiella melzeri]|nr:hypothetical protein BC835DRAFT_445072 [Cytidiella melzeri]
MKLQQPPEARRYRVACSSTSHQYRCWRTSISSTVTAPHKLFRDPIYAIPSWTCTTTTSLGAGADEPYYTEHLPLISFAMHFFHCSPIQSYTSKPAEAVNPSGLCRISRLTCHPWVDRQFRPTQPVHSPPRQPSCAALRSIVQTHHPSALRRAVRRGSAGCTLETRSGVGKATGL